MTNPTDPPPPTPSAEERARDIAAEVPGGMMYRLIVYESALEDGI
jgi:hypothetical protein